MQPTNRTLRPALPPSARLLIHKLALTERVRAARDLGRDAWSRRRRRGERCTRSRGSCCLRSREWVRARGCGDKRLWLLISVEGEV